MNTVEKQRERQRRAQSLKNSISFQVFETQEEFHFQNFELQKRSLLTESFEIMFRVAPEKGSKNFWRVTGEDI